MYPNKTRRIVKVAALLPVMLMVFALMIWAVYGLWNALMPDIFGLRTITYWQALGLMVLSWILFRGFRGPRFRGAWRRGAGGHWERLTPDEREELMKMLRRRWSGAPAEPPEAKA